MKLKCNAKINLCLNITGKRDDGYHLIDSVMQSISLCDIVDIEKSDKITVTCSKSEFSGKKNIAYKAAEAFFKYTQHRCLQTGPECAQSSAPPPNSR